MKIYNEFADWFHLLTHPSEYVGEAADYVRIIQTACPGARTLLELGAGGGNNAFHMKRALACTLTDVSPNMLRLSRSINPECEHIVGDMRTLRLGRLFDAVFVHDAVEYMTTASDVSQAAATAFAHTRPGGVALFVPDGTKETFRESVGTGGRDGPDGRGLRYLEWTMDADPSDDRYEVHFACLMRNGAAVDPIHDRHEHGLFTRQQWLDMLAASGFVVTTPQLDEESHEQQVAFVAHRPERS